MPNASCQAEPAKATVVYQVERHAEATHARTQQPVPVPRGRSGQRQSKPAGGSAEEHLPSEGQPARRHVERAMLPCLAQVDFIPAGTALHRWCSPEESLSECRLACHRKHAPPTTAPCGPGRSSEEERCTASFVFRGSGHNAETILTPSSPGLASKRNQPAESVTDQLAVVLSLA